MRSPLNAVNAPHSEAQRPLQQMDRRWADSGGHPTRDELAREQLQRRHTGSGSSDGYTKISSNSALAAPASLFRSSASLVNITAPRDSAVATTIASTASDVRLVPSNTPAAFAACSLVGSTVHPLSSLASCACLRPSRHTRVRTGAGTRMVVCA